MTTLRKAFVRVALAAAPLLPTGPLPASSLAAQGVGDATVVPIQVTGDPEVRFSMVILGDGYTAEEMSRFREHVDKHLNVLWSFEPWRSYRNYINVYAVEIVSGESGITCDPEVREERETPLGSAFGGGCENPNARGIRVDGDAARRYAEMATPHFDQTLTIANTDTYGGIGGRMATTSGGNSLGPLITPHELGHSLGGLSDEYTYSGRGRPGGVYDEEEPRSIHHTIMSEEEMLARQAKWWRWLGEESDAGGVIGRYPGGMGDTAGVWRPSKHSMMISLGYYHDQVGRERMTQRISEQVELIAASTPTDEAVGMNEVVWIETAHPVYHALDVRWEIDGRPLPGAEGRPHIDLGALGGAGRTVTVTVVDPTEFVRDPAIRDSALTATRSWTVGDVAVEPEEVEVAFTGSTQTERPLGKMDVVYVETTHPRDRVFEVTWTLNGQPADAGANDRDFHLGEAGLTSGTHTLTATVTDPADPGGGSDTLTWTVDNVGPTVGYALSEPFATAEGPGGTTHYFMWDEFTMLLEPGDDQPGYVVAEFRVNGDGWHHYYGWPDAPPGTPFHFTPRGTNIKELIYGSLSSEGLSPQPWEPRVPGWGTHTIEIRGKDAAGNIGEVREFTVTVVPRPSG